ncbi:hypothetical protein HEP87_17655 [Streptomyces sp. S1D4-11]|nr:hypothetical protein [Streptomyces sp. S1D4-11]QIY95530.1 hypothetical protein HEP87_17655 [Streptomyces sp. S1D4-11]
MAPEWTIREQHAEGAAEQAPETGQLSSLDIWSHCAPIRLAGYEEDLAEPHILPGID